MWLSSIPGNPSRALTLGALVLSALAVAGRAEAAAVTFNMLGGDPAYARFGRSVIDPVTGLRVNSDGMQGGRFKLSNLGTGTYTGDFQGPDPLFWAFCIEPRESIANGIHTLEVMSLYLGTSNIGGMGVAKANRLKELFGRWYPDFSQPLTQVAAGALQVAVWEIVREDSGTLDIYTGDIYFYNASGTTPGVLALAQTYVQSIDGTGPRAHRLVALYKVGTQDLIAQRDLTESPEPSVWAMCGLGLALLAAAGRRR